MAEMQVVLMAMGAVHASGKHAASGKLPAGEDFFQTLSARIESGLAAEVTVGKGLDLERSEVESELPDAARLAEILDLNAKAGLDGSQAGSGEATQLPVQSQDPLVPVLAMLWAANGQLSNTTINQEQDLPGGEAAVAQVGFAVTANRSRTADDAQARLEQGRDDGNEAAGLAARGQALPSGGGRADLSLPGLERADLPGDGKTASLEARSAMQEALSGLPTKPQAAEIAGTQPAVAAPDASRDLFAQRVIDPSARAAEAVSVPATIQAPLRSPAFANEFGDRLVWMVNRHVQSAELTLNPPQLGAVEVRLSMHGNEAGAQFYSANPQVREALDQAMSKLREIMAGAGITLGQATVSDQGFARQDQAAREQKAVIAPAGDETLPVQAGTLSLRPGVGLGLVDLYA